MAARIGRRNTAGLAGGATATNPVIAAEPPENLPIAGEQPPNVLIVEACEAEAERIVAALDDAGLRPVHSRAATGEEFAGALRQDLDLILCSGLPELDPPAALAVLGERGLAVPLIVVGAEDWADVAVEWMRRGASDYVHRERLEGLGLVVRRALAERERFAAERRAAAELSERVERFRLLVERIPAIVYMRRAGNRGETYYVSPAIESVLGYKVDDWLADPGLWADRLHPKDRRGALAQELYSRTSGEDFRTEYRIFGRDGGVVWIRDQATMVRRRDGSLDHMEGLMIDVTAEKEERLALGQARAEAHVRLLRAAELHDDEVVTHANRVGRYCELTGRRLGLGPERCERLRLASPMHDVGKAGVSAAVLANPGPLNADERAEIEDHPTIGYRLLTGSGVDELELAAVIAWTHHERFDGGGYPRGLAGDAIPLEGRIAAVADAFDGLTTPRPDREAYPFAEAVRAMRAESGSRFDPSVLEAFLSAEHEIGEILGSASNLKP